MEQFDDAGGGFFDTAADAEPLYTRPQDPTDNATPSGLSAAMHALALMAELTGEDRYAERAEQAARSAGGLARGRPGSPAGCWPTRSAGLRAATPVQVAVVGPDDLARAELVRAAYRQAPAGSVVVAGSSPTSRVSPCWPTGRCSTGGPRRTSAGTSSAGCRSTSARRPLGTS